MRFHNGKLGLLTSYLLQNKIMADCRPCISLWSMYGNELSEAAWAVPQMQGVDGLSRLSRK